MATTTTHRRLMRMTLRKHGGWLVCCAVFLAVMLVVDVSYWWQLTRGGATATSSGVLEHQLAFLLFLMALLWPFFGFDVLICHGVSRRTFARGQTLVNLVVACGAAVVLVAGWLVTTGLNTPLTLRLGASRFRYAYSTVMAHDGGIFRADTGVLPPSVAAAVPDVKHPLAMGIGYMFLGTLAMMVAMVMLGQVIGAMLLVLWSRGHRVLASAGLFVALAIVLGLGNVYTDLRPDGQGALCWLIDAAKGGIWTSLDGMQAVKTVVWIPLALAAVFAAVVSWVTHRLAARCEVLPERGRTF